MLRQSSVRVLQLLPCPSLTHITHAAKAIDRYINSRMEGVPVNRGLATPEEDDDDEEGPQG